MRRTINSKSTRWRIGALKMSLNILPQIICRPIPLVRMAIHQLDASPAQFQLGQTTMCYQVVGKGAQKPNAAYISKQNYQYLQRI
jgi:hypothetical protein